MLRDSLTFAVLMLIAVAMYGVTSFLFHSFEKHRDELGRDWIVKARQAMAAHRADEAVDDLRRALSFVPGDRENTLLMAEALAEAGRADEAANYYLGLWEQTPGDGPINLQLARVTRKTHQVPHFAFHGGLVYTDDPGVAEKAINYYRAAIYGTWPDRVIEHRYETRTELVDYLLGLQRDKEAHEELTVLAGRLPESRSVDEMLAAKFAASGDRDSALNFYEKAAAFDPRSVTALKKAADFAFENARFDRAAKSLKTLSERVPTTPDEVNMKRDLEDKQDLVTKILELDPEGEAGKRRDERLRQDARLAQQRLTTCIAKVGRDNPDTAYLIALERDWKSPQGVPAKSDDAASTADRIWDTYKLTAAACGKPERTEDLALDTLATLRTGRVSR